MNTVKDFLVKNISLWALASVTLGLAPFVPEPHIWKQIMNIYHGRLTATIDWLDLFMHGAPWLLLILALSLKYFSKKEELKS
jgi:hypothetical protein